MKNNNCNDGRLVRFLFQAFVESRFGMASLVGLIGLACLLDSRAAAVAWGSATTIAAPSDIQSTGLSNLAGAHFGRHSVSTGTITTVNNGSVDVPFTHLLAADHSVALTNGITVAVDNSWADWNANGGISSMTGDYGFVLEANIGKEDAPLSATITLSGLAIGTQYQIQFFAAATASVTQTISGSGNLNTRVGANGQYVVGTFTADAETQVLTVEATSGFVVANALTIGVAGGGPDTTPPVWAGGWPKAEQLSSTSVTVRAQTNETGTAYYAVLANGATAPTAAQVKAGNDSANAPALKSGNLVLTAANSEASGPVTGLTTGTTYDVYFVAEDAVPNLQAAPSMVSVTLSTSAVIIWGTPTTIAAPSDIQSTGLSNLAGAHFGRVSVSTGTVTTVNNGSVDVPFTHLLAADHSVALTNGITVAVDNSWGDWNANNGISSMTGDYGFVLEANIGKEELTPLSATITLSGLVIGTQYQIQFFAAATASRTETISGSGSLNLDTGANGQYVVGTFTAAATQQVLTVTGQDNQFIVANALTIGVVGGAGTTFADWINGYSGLNGLTGFNDDADFDGIANGLENSFGTAPNAGNAGLIAGTLSGTTFTFTHPQNATPASDVSAPVYTWSTDLQTFHASGASAGGTTVNLSAAPDTPAPGTTTVTATITGTPASKLFVRAGVAQE